LKALRAAGQTIEGCTWLILHLLGHILLIVGCVISIVDKGIEHALGLIRTTEDLLLQRLQEKR
jgi:hypothetical protein